MENKITLSVIKADVGSMAGNHITHPALLDVAESVLEEAKDELIFDFHVTHVGDDLILILTHNKGESNYNIHELAFKVFQKCTKVAKELNLYGAGVDIITNNFDGDISKNGAGVAELSFLERTPETLVVFGADKTEAGAFNLPLFKIFADPFNTPGLYADLNLINGFKFEIWDLENHKRTFMNTPEDYYKILALIGHSSRFIVKRIFPKPGSIIPEDEAVAVSSSERLNEIAGKYVGKDDPVMVVRAQKGLPSLGEILEPFTLPYLVKGWLRGLHWGPLMPVSVKEAHPTRFDGPARVIALGFQIKNGKLVGPADLFDDPAFDETRRLANKIASYIRSHGPFTPHRVEDYRDTTLPKVIEKLIEKFEPLNK